MHEKFIRVIHAEQYGRSRVIPGVRPTKGRYFDKACLAAILTWIENGDAKMKSMVNTFLKM